MGSIRPGLHHREFWKYKKNKKTLSFEHMFVSDIPLLSRVAQFTKFWILRWHSSTWLEHEWTWAEHEWPRINSQFKWSIIFPKIAFSLHFYEHFAVLLVARMSKGSRSLGSLSNGYGRPSSGSDWGSNFTKENNPNFLLFFFFRCFLKSIITLFDYASYKDPMPVLYRPIKLASTPKLISDSKKPFRPRSC